MNKQLIITICTAIIAALNGADTATEATTTAATPNPEPTPTPRPRGRPPKTEQPPADTTPAATGESDEDRYNKNRALIEPLVKAGQGAEVKKVIGKYSATGLKDLPAAKQAEFERDIEALSY